MTLGPCIVDYHEAIGGPRPHAPLAYASAISGLGRWIRHAKTSEKITLTCQ